MKKRIVLALITYMALLTGCEEETKSIRWYIDNPDDTYVAYKKCLKTGSGSENCENAKRGADTLSVSRDPEIRKRFEEFFPPQPIPQFN